MKKLNLGCGNKILEGFINVDIQQRKDIDCFFDHDVFPYPFEDDYFDYVLMDNVLEHLERPDLVLEEVHRIAKKGATVRIIVPYYNSHNAFNDSLHKHYFNKYSIENLVRPVYCKDFKPLFKIKKLILAPSPIGKFIPGFIREYVSWIFGWIINRIEVELIVLK